MKYLDLAGLETFWNNILSRFQQTYQLNIDIIRGLENYTDGDNVTSVVGFQTAEDISKALIAKKCVVLNGGSTNSLIPVSAAWGIENATSFDFGIAIVYESFDEFYAMKMDFTASKTNQTVTLTHKYTKLL